MEEPRMIAIGASALLARLLWSRREPMKISVRDGTDVFALSHSGKQLVSNQRVIRRWSPLRLPSQVRFDRFMSCRPTFEDTLEFGVSGKPVWAV